MSDIEVISLTIIVLSIIAAIAIIRVWPRKDVPVKTIPKTPIPDSFVWRTETTKNFCPPADDKVVFSTNKEEAKVIEEALEKHRSKKDKPVTKSEAESNLPTAKKEPEDFDTSLLASVEEGIASLEKKVIEASKNGDADFVKKAFLDLDWLEDLRDRLLDTLEAPRR